MDITRQLKQYYPRTPEEEKTKAYLLEKADMYGAVLLNRESMEFHITTSALILNELQDKVLMVSHNLFQAFTLPGGHADGDENLLHVAWKEAVEETGITHLAPFSSCILSIDILPVPAHFKRGTAVPSHRHFNITYGFTAVQRQKLKPCKAENSAVEWFDIADIDTKCHEAHMLPVYHKALGRYFEIELEKKQCYRKIQEPLLLWYQKYARPLPWRRDKDPYHIWISEIMLQQTRVEAVKVYYDRFIEALPTINDLACVSEQRLMKLWEGLGYYNRARNLQKAAKRIVSQYGGVFPTDYATISSLPGIGPYTAGAIASICFEKPIPAVDGNVSRIIARITECYLPIDTQIMKKKITEMLRTVYPKKQCGDFTQALMELGAVICLPHGTPDCDHCPVNQVCLSHRHSTQLQLPVRQNSAARRVEQRTVFYLTCSRKTAIIKRAHTGLLAGMWQLPNMLGILSEEEALSVVAQWGLRPVSLMGKSEKKHIFTHIEWHMTCFYIECNHQANSFVWASRRELADQYALPTAFRILLPSVCSDDL